MSAMQRQWIRFSLEHMAFLEDAILALKERGTTMLLVEQNSEMALRVADRGSILELGTVVASGTAAELSADTALVHRYLAV